MEVKMSISLAIQDPLTFNNFLFAFLSFCVLLQTSRRRQTNSIFFLEIYLCRSSSTLSTFPIFHIIVACGDLLQASQAEGDEDVGISRSNLFLEAPSLTHFIQLFSISVYLLDNTVEFIVRFIHYIICFYVIFKSPSRLKKINTLPLVEMTKTQQRKLLRQNERKQNKQTNTPN